MSKAGIKPEKLSTTPEWRVDSTPVTYEDALSVMENRVKGILSGQQAEMVWLLEHPPLYTAGTSARPEDLKDPRFPVYETGRGGQYTYHGPGQRVVYVLLDLKARQRADLRAYIHDLEEWIIESLASFGVKGERRGGRVGIWIDLTRHGRSGEAKIAAIGVRVRKWVTFHGISINRDADLSHYGGIVPCGLGQYGVTSLADLGLSVSREELDAALKESFLKVFR